MLKKLLPLTFFLCFAMPLVAQPANDDCGEAEPVMLDAVVTFSTVDATTVGPHHIDPPCSAANDTIWADVWYTFTATFTGLADWSICGTADFDTRIAVYKAGSACPPADTSLLKCNEDFGDCDNFTSRIVFNVEDGKTYYLRLGGFGEEGPGESGAGTFTVKEFVVTVPNDFCESAQEITLGENQEFTNVDALTDGPEHEGNPCFGFGDNTVQSDIWFKFTAPNSGTIEWTTCDQAFLDSRLAVYGPDPTCNLTDEDLLACNDDGSGCQNFTSKLFFDAEAGKTYLLRLGGYNGEYGTGVFDLLEVEPPVPPANDLCVDADSAFIVTAMMADDFDGIITGSTVNGTFNQAEFNFPPCLANTAGGEFADVWFWFNSNGNDSIQLRFNLDPENPVGSFYVDLYNACGVQVDTNVIKGACLFAGPNTQAPETWMTGFPEEPTLYLLHVTTRLTTQLPGGFFFFLVGKNTSPPSAAKEAGFPGSFQLFPNPAANRLYLNVLMDETANTTVKVANTLGQTVLTDQKGQLGIGAHRFDFDISALTTGVYFLQMQSEKGSGSIRFIKD